MQQKNILKDPSAQNNGGDLGFFTAFMMVYDFESAVYDLEINEISKPIKTKYGYHLIKLFDKKHLAKYKLLILCLKRTKILAIILMLRKRLTKYTLNLKMVKILLN